MSRFSEKRVAGDIVSAMEAKSSPRRRRELAIICATFAGGLIGNFYFNKIEVASALWTVTLLAVADLLLSFVTKFSIRWVFRIVLDFFLVGVMWAGSYPLVYNQYRSQHAALTSGVLRARPDGKDHSKEEPILQLGETGVSFIWTGKSNSLISNDYDKIKIVRVGNEIKLSVTVRDRFDNLIVEIVDNVWRVSKSETDCWDKNYTDDSLEVKDGRGRVVLQVRLLPDRVQMQVEWPTQGGRYMDNVIHQGKPFYTPEEGIRPRFQYPSSEHWGELDPNSGYVVESE
jgi:hypothetical protein